MKKHPGTHRARSLEETLEAFRRCESEVGVTRCANVTGLDDLGIPVFTAIRPAGQILQVANGKGLTPIAARLSACMEAFEHHWVERSRIRRIDVSMAAARDAGLRIVNPSRLEGFMQGVYLDDEVVLGWVPATNLVTNSEGYLPASYVLVEEPSYFRWSTNGLASGNCIEEATLHGLYEVIERHTLSLLVAGGHVDVGACVTIDTASIDDSGLQELLKALSAAGVLLRLLRVPVECKVHTFLALILDPRASDGATRVNLGAGAHLSPTTAATRAVTEAAQSRLTFIHGARDDLKARAYAESHERLYRSILRLQPDRTTTALVDSATDDIKDDLDLVLTELVEFGFEGAHRAILTDPDLPLVAVKVAVEGMLADFPL